MIVVRLAGGLGNQMFQYAFGRRLAHENKLPLTLDAVSGFQNDPYRRQYALGCFTLQAHFARREQVPAYIKYGRVVRRLGFVLQALLPRSMRSLIRERQGFVFDPAVLHVTRSAYVFGYWQCAQYSEPIAGLIRDEFTFKQPLSHRAQRLAQEMQSEGVVSVHVRRLLGISADGKPIPAAVKRHGACTPEYFQRAVAVIRERVKQPRFFVFSDQPAWCKENLDLGAPTHFVADEAIRSDVEELNLMSLCRHHIISNSSFGWWGAWLGRNPAQVVVAPARWMQDMTRKPPNLFPPDWVVI